MRTGGRLFIAVLAAAGVILVYQLFIPPIVGLADQGDFIRTIGRFGYGPQHHGALEYVYVEPKYIPDPHYRSPGWEQANSEYLFVAAALLVNKVVSKDGTLDITVAGLVHAIAFLAAFTRLLWVTRNLKGRALIWIGALIVLTDAGYAIYWNSFYAEPASCIFFLLLLAETVQFTCSGKLTPALILRWSLWSILWVLAKPQNAPLGLILAVFTLRLAWWVRPPWARIIPVTASCSLVACAIFNVTAMPTYGRMANTYGMIFSGILGDSKSPASDLEALGLNPGLAKYAGTGAWSAGTHYPEMAASGEMRSVSTFTIVRFYLARPARLWRRLHQRLPMITFLRYWYGNFEPSAGYPPATLSQAFNLWSAIHEHVLPIFNKWIVLALAGWPFVAAWRWKRARDAFQRRRIEISALLPICCLAALFSAVFGDAFDLVKHLYLFNLMLDTCLVYFSWLAWVSAQRLFSIRSRAFDVIA